MPVLQRPPPSRRMTSRVGARNVWAYWSCNGHDDVTRVLDLSLAGLFIATSGHWPLGAPGKIDFLVQEGQIRAEVVVRHVESDKGLGLKFSAIPQADRPHLAALLTRLRSLTPESGNP